MPNVTRIIKQQHRATASVHFALHALTRQGAALRQPSDFRGGGRWPGTLSGFPSGFTIRTKRPTWSSALLRREPGMVRIVARFGATMPRARATRTACATRWPIGSRKSRKRPRIRGTSRTTSHASCGDTLASRSAKSCPSHGRRSRRRNGRRSCAPSPQPQTRSSDQGADSNARRLCGRSARRRRPSQSGRRVRERLSDDFPGATKIEEVVGRAADHSA